MITYVGKSTSQPDALKRGEKRLSFMLRRPTARKHKVLYYRPFVGHQVDALWVRRDYGSRSLTDRVSVKRYLDSTFPLMC